jgi:hypothetical protein
MVELVMTSAMTGWHYKRRPADFPRQAISQIVATAAKNWLCFAKSSATQSRVVILFVSPLWYFLLPKLTFIRWRNLKSKRRKI